MASHSPRIARLALVLLLGIAGCTGHRPDVKVGTGPDGKRHALEGLASWYGPGFHGRTTASGEIYDSGDMTCAHKTLPFGTRILVRNLQNGRTCWVRVNDRGPFVGDRIVDLSYAAALALDMVRSGTARVALDLDAPPPPEQAPHVATFQNVPPMATEEEPRAAPLAIDPALAPWSVQVGAFLVADNASELAHVLTSRGVSARVERQGAMSRVRVGLYWTEEEARTAALALVRDGYEAVVVSEAGAHR